MGKRGNNAGTVYESPQGSGRWWAQLPAGPDGRRPRRYAGDGATKEDAERLLRQLHAEREAGRDHIARVETVAELLANLRAAGAATVRPSTASRQRRQDHHIVDRIGAMKIDEVTLDTVQSLANWLTTERRLGAGMVRTILGRLHAAYERVIPERVNRNPVAWKRLSLRKVRPAKRRPLEAEALRRLLNTGDDVEARGGEYRLAPAWWLMGLLGLRRGEVLGATWKDIDWRRGTLTVRQQYSQDGNNRYEFGPVKTEAGNRVLPVGPRLVERLRIHQAIQAQERLRRGKDWHKLDLIVCQGDGSPWHPTIVNRILSRVGRAAGIEHVHPHLLRHGVATLISEEGYSEAVIAGVLGHEKGGTTTRHYTHATDKAMRRAVEAIELTVLGSATEAGQEAR